MLSIALTNCGGHDDEPGDPNIPDNPGTEEPNNPADTKKYNWALTVHHNWDWIQKAWKNRAPEMNQWLIENERNITASYGDQPLSGMVVYKIMMIDKTQQEIEEYSDNVISWSVGWDIPVNDSEKYWAYDVFTVTAFNQEKSETIEFYPDVKDSYPN